MAKIGALLDQDHLVANWVWDTWQLHPMPINWAMGLIKDNKLVGAAFFQWYNGCNIELNYYGPGTPTLGIGKILARVAIQKFNVQRVTARLKIDDRRLIHFLMKIGFKLEGSERRFYGPNEHAVRLVIFREEIEKIARL